MLNIDQQRAQEYRVEWVSLLTGEINHGPWIQSKDIVIEWVATLNTKWKGQFHHIYSPRWYGAGSN